ncbi:MAG: hypothetical protein N2053_04200, partial [Chitinispirillaceae bacterium]|nr:hypothetical protein [Chitinispirillaceae bacterium]
MHKSIFTFAILMSLYTYSQQSTDYLIVEAPIGVKSADRVLWVKWTGISRNITIPAPDSGIIFFDKSPGGGELKNYRYKVT